MNYLKWKNIWGAEMTFEKTTLQDFGSYIGGANNRLTERSQQ